MANNQLLPFGTAGGANVLDYATYSAGSWRLTGFTAGTAVSQQLNTVWRQSSFGAAMIGQYVADYSGQNVNDDGDVATFEANFVKSLAYPIQNKRWNGFDDTGTADAVVITPVPAPTAYVAYQTWWVKKGATANATTTPTLNVAALGAKTLVRADGSALAAGDLIGGGVFEAQYDGTNFRILTNSQQSIKRLALKRVRVTFTSTGSFNWTVPVGVTAVKITAWGAGGGGGAANNASGAGGGGGGGKLEVAVDVTPGGSITGSVGTGGTGGIAGGATATAGGNTTITVNGVTYTAGGGAAGPSSGGGTTSNSASGGSITGTVDIAKIGQPSAGGVQGYSGSGTLYYGGKGGDAPDGGLGGLAGTGAANAGQAPGGGGGGSGANGSSAAGGAGARGEVWLEY